MGGRHWNTEGDDFLLQHYLAKTPVEMANELDRTRASIKHRLTKLYTQGKISLRPNPVAIKSLKKGIEILERMDLRELIYIAGLIDGEGYITCFHKGKGKQSVRVCIYNTNEGVWRFLEDKFGKKTFISMGGNRLGKKECRVIALHGWEALPLLQAIEPYSVIKKEETRKAINTMILKNPFLACSYENPFDISICWFCGGKFQDSRSDFHDECQTFSCPHCHKCFCDLPADTQLVLDREMHSIRFWEPFHNPKKRKRRSSNVIRGVSREDFIKWVEKIYPDLATDYHAGRLIFDKLLLEAETRSGLAWVF